MSQHPDRQRDRVRPAARSRIRLVAWDHDRVLIPTFVTSILAATSREPVKPFVEELLSDGWIQREEIRYWCKQKQRSLRRVRDLADLLTDFLYEFRRPDGGPFLGKERVKTAKQRLLRGLSVGEILEAVERTPWTAGIPEVVQEFRVRGLSQIICSDSLHIAVMYQARRLGMDTGLGVPARLDTNSCAKTSPEGVDTSCGSPLDAKLTGEIFAFNKSAALMQYCGGAGIASSEVLAIDDSAANLENLHLLIHNAGGVAVAFNPTASDANRFVNAGIPVVRKEETSKLLGLLS